MLSRRDAPSGEQVGAGCICGGKTHCKARTVSGHRETRPRIGIFASRCTLGDGASVINDEAVGDQAERLCQGDWYLDDAELRGRRNRCWHLLNHYNATGPDDDRMREHLLLDLFGEVGLGVVVMPRFQCSYGQNITVGEGAFINSNAFLMDDAPIHVGAHARLGPGAQLMTALHPVDDHSRRRDGWERAESIKVGENAWLGAGVIVGAGVSIGRNSVIGAGSVVLGDVPEHVVAAGSPARVMRSTHT